MAELNNKLESEREEVLCVINEYSRTWDLLIKYDENRLESSAINSLKINQLSYNSSISAISKIKEYLKNKGESVRLFGNEKDDSLKGILRSVYQTFDGNDLYDSFEEKASYLLYFIIKDHPFSDGNKRIGCFLFLLFIEKNKHILINKPTPEALTSMALLIAQSLPEQKDVIIKLIINLIQRENI